MGPTLGPNYRPSWNEAFCDIATTVCELVGRVAARRRGSELLGWRA